MKKLLFFGDSLTDMSHSDGKNDTSCYQYGIGYVFFIAGELTLTYPNKYQIINKGIGGNRLIDLYQRYKRDVLDEKPDVLTILIGVNEILMNISYPSMCKITPIDEFISTYKLMIEDIKKNLPNTKIILMEPFILDEESIHDIYPRFKYLYLYQNAVKDIASKMDVTFISLQDKMNNLTKTHKIHDILFDGIHTNAAGAKLICDEWIKVFQNLK